MPQENDYHSQIQVRVYISEREQVRDSFDIAIYHSYRKRDENERYTCLQSKAELLAEIQKKLADWEIRDIKPRFSAIRKGRRHLNYTLRSVTVILSNYKHYERKKAICQMLNKKMITE